MPAPKLTGEIIDAAVEGFDSQKRRLDAQTAELRQMLNSNPTGSAATSARQEECSEGAVEAQPGGKGWDRE